MCGFVGFVDPARQGEYEPSVLERMTDALINRGPDDVGYWNDSKAGVSIGHRRLSILDLSPAGHQPMESSCGRYVLAYNGEIYNHKTLRGQLAVSGKIPQGGWRGQSDTETLLACISTLGVDRTMAQTVGMFAFAVWDRQDHKLTLVRDRIGEKPLYYGWQKGTFLFGSELKALVRHPSFQGEIDWGAAQEFLRYRYIPGPRSIYRGLQKLQPGSILELTQNEILRQVLPKPRAYWSMSEVVLRSQEEPFRGSFEEAVEALEGTLRSAVRDQLVADVPVGAFLSGGIDSSTVVSMMRLEGNGNIRTFCVAMPDDQLNEAQHAKAVAGHLGTEHNEIQISSKTAIEMIPRLHTIWDEPFADSSQLPTLLVSQYARSKVTVALTGDGGDEFFMGYPYYPVINRLWKFRPMRCLPIGSAGAALSLLGFKAQGKRITNLSLAWKEGSPIRLARFMMDQFKGGATPLVKDPGSNLDLNCDPSIQREIQVSLWDINHFLPDDILVKTDRAAMHSSLETRTPILDHRVIEFAFKVPMGFKLQGALGKRLLKKVLYRHVPQAIVDRPKQGFTVPIGRWLRTELRPWFESLLEDISQKSDLWHVDSVRALWKEHDEGRRNWADKLWSIASLQSFLAEKHN